MIRADTFFGLRSGHHLRIFHFKEDILHSRNLILADDQSLGSKNQSRSRQAVRFSSVLREWYSALVRIVLNCPEDFQFLTSVSQSVP